MFNVRLITAATVLLLSVASAAESYPGVENTERARVNYMLNCQGCHGREGVGTADGVVPEMKDFVGRFLSVPGGRAFLVRVPGSANSALPDERLAEVLNWMLPNLSPAEIPEDFVPYTAAEVGELRIAPLVDPVAERARLIQMLE